MNTQGYILLADDHRDFLEEFALWLQEKFPDYEIKEAEDSDAAWELFHESPHRCRLAIIDYKLDGVDYPDGLALMQAMRQQKPMLPVLIITGVEERRIAEMAIDQGAHFFLEKPLDLFAVEMLIRRALRPSQRSPSSWREQVERQLQPEQVELSNRLLTAEDLQALEPAIRKILPRLFDAQAAYLVRFRRDTGEPVHKAFVLDHQDRQIRFFRHYLDGSLSTALAERGECRIVVDTQTEEGINPELPRQGIRAFGGCACPPNSGAPLVLYIYFDHPIKAEEADRLKAQLITWSRIIGLTYEQLRQRELMFALAETSAQILEASGEEEVYHILARVLQTHFEVNTFYFARHDSRHQRIVFPFAWDKGKEVDLNPLPLTKESLTGCIIQHDCALTWDGQSNQGKFECGREVPSSCRPVVEGERPSYYYGVPVRMPDNTVIGALSIQRYHPRKFQPAVKKALEILASQMGQAFFNHRYRRYEKVLEQASRDFRKHTRKADLIRAAIETLAEVWPDCVPSILEYRPEKGLYLDPKANERFLRRVRPEFQSHLHFDPTEGIVGWVATVRETYNAPDVTQDAHYEAMIPETRSEIAVPIQLGGRLLGVLDVESPEKAFFGEAERYLLKRLADELAIAWGAAGQQEYARDVLRASLRAVKSDQPLKALAEEVYGVASLYNPAGETGPTMVAIFLHTQQGLEPVAAYPENILQRLKQEVGTLPLKKREPGTRRGIVVRAAMERAAQLVRDVTQDPDYIALHEETRAELAVPILGPEGELLGVLNVEYKHPEDLTEEDQQLLETLASQVGVVSIVEREQVRQQQLSTALALVSLNAVERSHTLKTLSGALEGTLSLLKNCLLNPGMRSPSRYFPWLRSRPCTQREIKEWLERMERILKRIGETRRRIQQEPPPDENRTAVNLTEILQEIHAYLQGHYGDQPTAPVQVGLEAPEAPLWVADANKEWLKQALTHLVVNAAQAAQKTAQAQTPSGKGRVLIRAHRDDATVRIQVQDNGPGIPPEVQQHLFRSRVPKEYRQGWGLGNLISAFVVRLYGGEIRIKDTGPSGTIIEVTLPAARAK